MTQQLDFDFDQAPIRHPNYFYPLELLLDPEEKDNFIRTGLVPYKNKIKGSGMGLSNVGNADQYFKRTMAATNQFLVPLGLVTRRMTLFLSDQNATSWVIHCDGVRDIDNNPARLEARLSYYEIADAPGAIRWWDNLPNELAVYPAAGYTQERITCIADCAEDLRNNKITWADIPAPAFATVSSVPSAILRTNHPHHVIQGPGLRVTVSYQLVFPNGSPHGVWEHIENNIHKLGV
jgi:hypothetical protein